MPQASRILRRSTAAAALLGCCLLGAAGARPGAPRPPWAEFLAHYEQSYFVAHPEFAVAQGRHEFDGRLPDWSARGIARELARLSNERRLGVAYTDAELTARQRFERDYLVSRIDADLFWLRDAREPFRNPGYYIGSLDPAVYLKRPYATPEVRLRAFIGYALAVPRAARQIAANLQSPLPRTFVALAVDSFDGYAGFFRTEVPGLFAGVGDAALQRRLAAAIAPAAAAMQRLADRMRREQPRANDAYALGPELYSAMLRMTERVDTPVAELEAIARADLQRNRDALSAACAVYAPGLGNAACVARVNADKPAGGAVEGAREQLEMLHRFVADHDLVSIPGDETALVAEAPEYQRWNFAYIDIPGPYEKAMQSVYNIAPADSRWPADEQAAYTPGRALLLFTSVHEVWPGHFLQFLHAKRSPFVFGRVFGDYAYSEGWAHYAEELMWEAGLGDGGPEIHVGQLVGALLRDVRFICSIGLHTRGMSVAECETMFIEQAYADRGNARQQAARGTFDPGYLNYTLGKLMIRKLRQDWTASRGGRAAWKAFHDAFLSYGGPPIPLVRAQMLGAEAGRDMFGY